MRKRVLLISLVSLLSLFVAAGSFSADKLKVSTGVKVVAVYYLPLLAAQEKGFWSQNGLDGEWIPFNALAPMHQGMVTGSVDMGLSTAMGELQGASAGVPTVIVADLLPHDTFAIWVRGDSPLKEPKELKGTRLGVSRFGGPEHGYGRLVVKKVGIEKDVKFVGTGGIAESLAALKTGSIEGMVMTADVMARLKVEGQARELTYLRDYRPKEWASFLIFAHRDFLRKNPDTVKRAVKAILQAADFVKKDEKWTIEKMKSFQGVPPEAAKFIYDQVLDYSKDGRISRKGLENVIGFLAEFGIVAKEKALPVDEVLKQVGG